MQYFKNTRSFRYEAQNTAKVHILKNDTHWLCGLKRKSNFEEVAFSDDLSICVNCQVAAGMKENDRAETFKGFIVRHVMGCVADMDPDKIIEGLELACKRMEEDLVEYDVKCFVDLESHFADETIGFIRSEANAKQYSIRFTYKRHRKVRMHFESASRHYLTLPLNFVFGPESNRIGVF